MSNPRFMIAAAASGSGKTMITCGILKALKERGMRVSAFKCGPDYIDPMFHEKVLKTKSRNLDPFFTERDMTRYLFASSAKDTDISVMEGVMGYYDGLGGISTRASAYELARITETPVILVVGTKGMSLSALAMIQGFLNYRRPSRIAGVILNQTSGMLYPRMKEAIERELQIPVLGYVPNLPDMSLKSRHLGLVLPEEVEELEAQTRKLAEILEESLDMEGIIGLAENAPAIEETAPSELKKVLESDEAKQSRSTCPVIAVAKDEAFCFLYEDNIRLLRELGARIAYFSPVHDARLPFGACGLILCGGYPELYGKELEANGALKKEIREKLHAGLPCLAECGGFMYLHEEMEDLEKRSYEMAGVIPGKAYYTGKLGRFGYVTLEGGSTELLGSKSEPLRAHEFHYFDSTSCGEDFKARKPVGERSWNCIHGTGHSLLGFPHLYYYANPGFALEFIKACMEFGGKVI